MNAYHDMIEKAEKFIYIENQYFISNTTGYAPELKDTPLKNYPIANQIAAKIIEKIESKHTTKHIAYLNCAKQCKCAPPVSGYACDNPVWKYFERTNKCNDRCMGRRCKKHKEVRFDFKVLINIPLINEPLHYYDRWGGLETECDLVMNYQQKTLYKNYNAFADNENLLRKGSFKREHNTQGFQQQSMLNILSEKLNIPWQLYLSLVTLRKYEDGYRLVLKDVRFRC